MGGVFGSVDLFNLPTSDQAASVVQRVPTNIVPRCSSIFGQDAQTFVLHSLALQYCFKRGRRIGVQGNVLVLEAFVEINKSYEG